MSQAALDALVKMFDASHDLNEKVPAENVIDLCSGGVRKKGAPLPALYADQSAAIRSWYDALNEDLFEEIVVGGGHRWIERPKIEKYQITMMDARGTHRLVDDRYTVESRIVFGK